MAILIKAEYSKKLGLPLYSSHQFSVSLTAEVGDATQVHAEVARLYSVLQESVDTQIVNTGFMPGTEPVPVIEHPPIGIPTTEVWACSPAQKNLILDLVERHNLDKAEVETLAKERFGCGVRQLNKLKASGLIDELLERFGETKPRFNGRGPSAPRRPNGYATRRVP